MKSPLFVLTLLALQGASAWAQSGGSYDPMADLVSTAKKEINAQGAIESSKDKVLSDPRRKKIADGFWQFFQGKRGASPGEYCTAVFWKGDSMISVIGPGGEYRGALLGFVAVSPKNGFPRPNNPQQTEKVKVTLTQGSDAPATLTALNRSIGGFTDEIVFAVPTIEATLAGMEEKQAFKIDYQGREVFKLDWHSGTGARAMMAKCLKGEMVDGKEVP